MEYWRYEYQHEGVAYTVEIQCTRHSRYVPRGLVKPCTVLVMEKTAGPAPMAFTVATSHAGRYRTLEQAVEASQDFLAHRSGVRHHEQYVRAHLRALAVEETAARRRSVREVAGDLLPFAVAVLTYGATRWLTPMLAIRLPLAVLALVLWEVVPPRLSGRRLWRVGRR